MKETQVKSLGQEDPLEKGMATHSSILGEFYGRGAWQGSPWGSKELDMTEWFSLHFTLLSDIKMGILVFL